MNFVSNISLNSELVNHEKRVCELCKKLYSSIDSITNSEKMWLSLASRNHDVGKHCIPESVLNVPRSLTSEERKIVDMHSYLGYLLLKEENFCEEICLLVLLHHGTNKYHGGISVYDDRLIWLSNIIRICDIYDALVSKRVYKKGMTKEEALSIIQSDVSLPEDLKKKFEEILKTKKHC